MSEYKKNKAVALKYSAEDDVAPVVIASGYGHMADKIIDVAEQKGIPVYRDDGAASLLCMLQVGSNIPTELYEVVAALYGEMLNVAAEVKNKSSVSNEQSKHSVSDILKRGRQR